MSNQLSIQSALPVLGSGESQTQTRGSMQVQGSVQAPVLPPVPKPVPLFVNPSRQFDPTVGIEVIQFHDSAGAVSSTIPSQRQLAAYRSHQATLPGEPSPEPPRTTQTENAKAAAG
jgi:hypothetical protein